MNERCKRNYEVDDWKQKCAAFIAAQNAIFSCYWREDEELNNTAAEAIECEEGANATGGKVKSTRELKWQVYLWSVYVLTRSVKENREQLVGSCRVKGKSCIYGEVYNGLASKDFRHSGAR